MNVCRSCRALLRQSKDRNQLRYTSRRTLSWAATPAHEPKPRRIRASQAPAHTRLRPYASPAAPHRSASGDNISAQHQRVQELGSSVLQTEDGKLPEEQRILYVFEQYEQIASSLLDPRKRSSARTSRADTTATSALLGSVNAKQQPHFITRKLVLSAISDAAYAIVKHPTVFITPAVLKAYVELQSLLSQPQFFPEVFDLYARKPVPKANTAPVQYAAASPDKVSAAVPVNTADSALTAAIKAHDLFLAMEVIDTTYRTPAFKKSKTLRRAFIPMAGLAVAPAAAYTLSQQYSAWQTSMDPQMATGIAFAGIMTYVSAVSMVGYVAVTTANDQMDRVTWAQGVPLWERWIREEERAAIDRVAGAWGFQEREKRGEEEGEEWNMLREMVGMRGMMLDRVELMDGME